MPAGFFELNPKTRACPVGLALNFTEKSRPTYWIWAGFLLHFAPPRFWGNESGLAGPFFVCGTDFR